VTDPRSAGSYAVGDAVVHPSFDAVPDGTNLLLVGDDASGAPDCVHRLLAQAPHAAERVILVTTEAEAGTVVERYQSVLADPGALDHLFVVDASASGVSRDVGPLSPTHVEAASSPADITGIGIGITNHLRSMETDRVRLGMVSLSPVLERLGAERTFAFLHVLTGRVRQLGHLGAFVVDPTRHEAEHVDVLRSLTDGTFRFRATDDGRAFRGEGAVDAVAEWTPLD
jgi:KaiC/GvpD/RAD55 family RecA-like ATPase